MHRFTPAVAIILACAAFCVFLWLASTEIHRTRPCKRYAESTCSFAACLITEDGVCIVWSAPVEYPCRSCVER